MALKWAGILVTVIALTLAVTANLFATDESIPEMVNYVTIATAAVAILVAIIADLYVRLNSKLNEMQLLMTSRFDRLDAETGDRNSGFVEGYLLGRPADSSVVPMTPRNRRAAAHGDD